VQKSKSAFLIFIKKTLWCSTHRDKNKKSFWDPNENLYMFTILLYLLLSFPPGKHPSPKAFTDWGNRLFNLLFPNNCRQLNLILAPKIILNYSILKKTDFNFFLSKNVHVVHWILSVDEYSALCKYICLCLHDIKLLGHAAGRGTRGQWLLRCGTTGDIGTALRLS